MGEVNNFTPEYLNPHVSKRSGNFLTGTWTHATIRYEETPSLRFELCSSLLEGWNEERDRRLEVVKLLTALSYCVAALSFVLCSSTIIGIAFTV